MNSENGREEGEKEKKRRKKRKERKGNDGISKAIKFVREFIGMEQNLKIKAWPCEQLMKEVDFVSTKLLTQQLPFHFHQQFARLNLHRQGFFILLHQ